MAQNGHTELDLAALRRSRTDDDRRTMRWPRPSQRDELTGLADHRYLDVLADPARFRLLPGRPVAYVKIDVDDQETINRRWGRLVGNAVLNGVGTLLAEACSGCGAAMRIGGDEFFAVLPGFSVEEAWIWAESLRIRIERMRFGAGGTDQVVTVSIGVVGALSNAIDPHMTELADGAVELARRLDGNHVCTWDWVEIDAILRQVARQGELDLETARQAFLDKCGYLLGPTQTTHITAHCESVARVARSIAETMDADGELKATVWAAGLLHDIGKCVIPEQLLSKPASLSLPEWTLMSRHAEIGARMASQLGADDEIVRCVRHHHDRHDALPVADLDVPLGARVLCVADALVTMASPRSYALTLPAPEALHEITAESGRQFDPDVVSAALRTGPDMLARAA